MRLWRTAVVFVLLSGHLVLMHQVSLVSQTPSSDPTPTFRTGIEAVQIDAFVTDERGNPVRDLTVGDFEVLEGGVPRPLTSFAFVDIPIQAPLGPAESWLPPPDVVANDGPEGRIYLLAVDVGRDEWALRTRAFLRRFLEEHFGPNDLAAVVLGGRNLRTDGHDFTSNPHLLLEAIDKIRAGTQCEPPPGTALASGVMPVVPTVGTGTSVPMARVNANSLFVRERLARIRQFAELLANVPGGRKTMLYFTTCLEFDMFDVMDYRGGVLGLAAEDAHAAMSAATRGNVVVYPLDPRGLTEGAEASLKNMEDRMDLTALATATGGFPLSNSNGFEAAFERILQENSTYYALGFNSAYERRDGRLVRLDVRVKRPGLRVRTREGYLAPLGRPRRNEAEETEPVLRAMATPLAVRGLGLSVFAAPYRGAEREAAVALAFEIDGGAVTLAEQDDSYRGELDVTYTAVRADNRAYPGARHSIALTLAPDRYEQVRREGLRVGTQLALPEGRYQIRVAVAAGARAGSVVYDLEVPDFRANGLHMSGLSLTTDSAARVLTMRPEPSETGRRNASRCRPPTCVVPLVLDGAPSGEDPLRDGLSGPPTTSRDFYRSDEVELYVEVYENVRRPPAHTIELRTELRAADGRVVPLSAEQRPSTGPTTPSGGHAFTARLPLHDVSPEAYVLHVEASSDYGGGATVSRAVPIRVR